MAPIRSPKHELHVPIAKVFDAKKESTSMAKFQSILLSPRRLRDQLYCSNEAKFILSDTGLTRAMDKHVMKCIESVWQVMPRRRGDSMETKGAIDAPPAAMEPA